MTSVKTFKKIEQRNWLRLLDEKLCPPFILTSMGGLCQEGHEFLRLCKKRNKGATLHLLDVLVTQHAKWTANRLRRGLFGQSLVDFSTPSWSSIQIKESGKATFEQKRMQPRKTPRLLRDFAQSRVVTEKQSENQHRVPGMSQYTDDVEEEIFVDADQDFGAASQRCKFFELSPR